MIERCALLAPCRRPILIATKATLFMGQDTRLARSLFREIFPSVEISDRHEWLETDGLGGFAGSTTSGVRTRRYHALLLTATTPPAGRLVLVNGFDAWLESDAGKVWLSAQRYAPDFVNKNECLRSFQFQPWPQWSYRLALDLWLEHEIFVPRGQSMVVLSWRLSGRVDHGYRLTVKPFLSGRDYHSTHHQNEVFRFQPTMEGDRLRWQTYPGIPAIVCRSRASYRHDPQWYRNFLYTQEQERGLDFLEDLAAPGELIWQLDRQNREAILTFQAEGFSEPEQGSLEGGVAELRLSERERRAKITDLNQLSAQAYFVRRGTGKSIIAGYPWFADWGRDTFISIRGLGIATGDLELARDILLEWASHVSEGMLPNRFPDQGEAPEYNSVDASLWFIIAAGDLLDAASGHPGLMNDTGEQKLKTAIEAILTGYQKGTRFQIRLEPDGLLAAGVPGVQLTWMDAKVDGKVITPRVGKPVEVQALWINALAVGKKLSPQWDEIFGRACQAFESRFWNEAEQELFDVVDVDHQSGITDPATRPNQIFAVGGLPLAVLSGPRARQVVDRVEAKLWTPCGLRSLAQDEPGFVPHYIGGPVERDSAYHQGTVWPWLAGPFIEAWVRVRGNTPEAKQEARQRFFEPIRALMTVAGLNHLPEITDAVDPYTPRGCPFQAWSLGELLRLDRVVLAATEPVMCDRPASGEPL
jgi:predicted glycogen debranching enzyme